MKNERGTKDFVTIDKMVQRIHRVISYCTDRSYDDFERDTMLQEACVFNIIQIGELSKYGLSDSFKESNPNLPWNEINGLRNHIVHGYEGVRLNIVWDTINNDFPDLLAQLKALLK